MFPTPVLLAAAVLFSTAPQQTHLQDDTTRTRGQQDASDDVPRVGDPQRLETSPKRADGLDGSADISRTAGGGVIVKVGRLLGRILSVDESQVTIEMLGKPGSRATLPVEKMPHAALFTHFSRDVDMKDAAAVRDLADRAGRFDLHFQKVDVLDALAELRPEDAEAIETERQAAIAAGAASRLERAEMLRSAGEFDRALRYFRDAASYGDVAAARAARATLEEIDADASARETASSERDRRRRVAASDEKLDAIYTLSDEADAALTEGRKRFEDLEDATEILLGAEETLDEAREQLDELAGDQPTEAHKSLRMSLTDTQVQVHVELGYVYASLGDEQSARRHAGLASSLDPNDATVRQLRAAIASRDAFDTFDGDDVDTLREAGRRR